MLTVRTIDLGRMPYRDCWEYQQRLFDVLTARRGDASSEAGWLRRSNIRRSTRSARAARRRTCSWERSSCGPKEPSTTTSTAGATSPSTAPDRRSATRFSTSPDWGIGLREYIFRLEESVIEVVGRYGIRGARIAGASGVWIVEEGAAPRKICAIGVRASRFVTMHGFALNVSTDLGGSA